MRSVALGLVVFALGLAAAVLVASPGAGAHTTDGTLSANVGPGFSISMSSSSVTAARTRSTSATSRRRTTSTSADRV